MKDSIAADCMTQIVDVCQRLDARQLVANHDGNVSVRLSEDRFGTTPTAFAKKDIQAKDLLIVDFEGKVLEGIHKIFSEWKWHRAIYSAFPEVSSVCHAHPPFTMAWSLLQRKFGYGSIPEALVSLGGPLQTTDFLSPMASEHELKSAASFALQGCYAFLVPGNGVFAVGDNPLMAYLRVELVEQMIRAHMLALQHGSVRELDAGLIQELINKRPPLKPTWSSQAGYAEAKADKPSATQNAVNEDRVFQMIQEIIRQELSK